MSLDHFHKAIARRPAVPAAVLFILGICLHHAMPVSPLAWVISLAVLLILAVTLVRKATVCSLLVTVALVIAGIAAGQLSAFYYPDNHIGAFAGDEPRLAWIEASIEDSPRVVESPFEGRKLPEKQTLLVKVCAVRTWNGWVPARGGIPVTISPPRLDLAAGQTVRMLGRLEREGPAMNPGAFDASKHFRRQRVLTSMHVSRPYDVEIISKSTRFSLPLEKLRDAARGMLSSGFDSHHRADLALLDAMVFGERGPELRDVADDFTRAGAVHLLAANGARIAILAGMIYLLCRLLRLRPRGGLALITVASSLFGLLTMPAAEALRPVIVCAAIGMGIIGRRVVDSLQVLAIAAVAWLVLKPLDLYGAGFQMSFVIVLALILLMRPLLNFLERFENQDRKVARSFLPQTSWTRARRWLLRWAYEAAIAGMIAWLAAAPLAAYQFEQLNPWTVPISILLTPFALLALLGGFLKIGLTLVCPALAGGWATFAALPSSLLRYFVHGMANLPGADLPLSRPPVWQLLAFYALICLPLVPFSRRPLRWCARSAPAGACTILMLMPLLGGGAALHSNSRALRVTLLSVGAGQCIVVESAGGVVLLDAGSSNIIDPTRTCIEPFLRHEQCRSIDAIWLSHGDFDHISAVKQLMPEYDVRQVLVSRHFLLHAHESGPCQSLLKSLDTTQHFPRRVAAGDRMQIGPDAEIDVLWPPPDSTFNSNNAGLVLRLTCCGRSILFPADIQEPAERELLKHPELLRSDILVAPHHGSSEASTTQFIAAVNPKVIVASNDTRLTKKQRVFEADIGGRPLYRTGRCGAITIDVSRDGTIDLAPFLPGPAQHLPPAR